MESFNHTALVGAGESAVDLVSQQTTSVDAGLFNSVTDKAPVPISALRGLEISPVDTFLPRLDRRNQMLRFLPLFATGANVDQAILDLVEKLGLSDVFVPGTQFDRLVVSCRRKLLGLVKDDSVPLKQKASLLFGNAQLLAAQALQREELEQSVENALYYFDSVVYFVQATPGASAELCRMLTYDYTLFNHSINVSLLAVGFGSFLDLGTRDIHNLGLGALFHDLGKTKLEDKVLKKRGALDPDEWEQVRRHPRIGFQLLGAMKHFPAECLDMVHYHHENIDGSGYPYGLKGRQLSRPAMIAKIIDCYDAITSDRSYKRACSGAEAIKIMHQQMGGQLSRELFMAFIAFLGDLDDGGGRGPDSRPRVLQDRRPA